MTPRDILFCSYKTPCSTHYIASPNCSFSLKSSYSYRKNVAQLVALPKIDPLQGVNLGHCDIKTVDVQIKHPAKVYNVFKNEPYRLPQLSPNHVASVTSVEGEWGQIGSKKYVVYHPEGKVVNCQTEWFIDELVCANESLRAVAWKALEGDVLNDYEWFFARLVVYESNAQWTIAYKKKKHPVPDPYKYLDLLAIVTKDVDKHPSTIN